MSTDFLALPLICFNIRQHGREILYFELHVDGRKFHYRRPLAAVPPQVVHRWYRMSNDNAISKQCVIRSAPFEYMFSINSVIYFCFVQIVQCLNSIYRNQKIRMQCCNFALKYFLAHCLICVCMLFFRATVWVLTGSLCCPCQMCTDASATDFNLLITVHLKHAPMCLKCHISLKCGQICTDTVLHYLNTFIIEVHYITYFVLHPVVWCHRGLVCWISHKNSVRKP